MGLYWTKCKKCGAMWGFISVTPMHLIGEPCKCDSKYHKPCNSIGEFIE